MRLVECWGDELPEGQLTSFPMAVKCHPDKTVVFSWISWPSKASHNADIEKFMNDPRIKAINIDYMPFDGEQMIYGGFRWLLMNKAVRHQ